MQLWRRFAVGATAIAALASVVGLAAAPATAAPDLRPYANTLVQRVGGTESPKASWFVTSDLKRLYVPGARLYWCLRKRGAVDRGPVRGEILVQLHDQVRHRAACGSFMSLAGELRKGMFLKSANGRVKLILQSDGNLVLYGPSGALWSTQQFDTTHVVFEGDGNFVTYRADDTPTWAADTRLKGGKRLIVQDDGNLVMYSGTRAIWSTGTHV